jgi:IBR domain, a half RING-finger domain
MVVADEYQSENFTYCADPKCSSFIKSTLIDDNIGMCPECFKRTCFSCQKLELVHHNWPKRQCPIAVDEEQAKLKDVAGEKEWRAYPRCRAIVERSDGCNHMKRHCQQKFCYQCGVSYEGDEPQCRCGLGLNYRQEQVDAEAEEDEDFEEEQAPDEEDDEEEEDEIDALHRQQLQQAGIQLARGDLARIRWQEIQLSEEGQQRLTREREEIRASAQRQAVPQLPRDPATEQLRQIEENRRRRFKEAGLVYE